MPNKRWTRLRGRLVGARSRLQFDFGFVPRLRGGSQKPLPSSQGFPWPTALSLESSCSLGRSNLIARIRVLSYIGLIH